MVQTFRGTEKHQIESQSGSSLPPKLARWVSTILAIPGPSVELDIPPLWTPQPSNTKTGPVSVPYMDLHSIKSYKSSSVISTHNCLSEYTHTGDWEMEEEGEPTGKPEDGSVVQGTIDMLDFLHTLWKINQGLMMQVHGIKGLINVVERMGISSLPALLPILRSVSGVTSSSLSWTVDRMKASNKMQMSKDLETTRTPVTIDQHLQLPMHEWKRKRLSGDTLFYCQLAILHSMPKSTLYRQITSFEYKVV